MVDSLKAIGVLICIVGLIAGIILLTKAEESVDTVIGIAVAIQGFIIAVIFYFFSDLLAHAEWQTELLQDIRNHFIPDENKETDEDVENAD